MPTDGFEESVARCGFRNALPGRDATRCAQMGATASCIPVPTGARGGGGGRGHRDTHDYAGTSRPRAAELHAPTADLPAEDKVTTEMECMEEGYLAKIVQGDGAKEVKVGEMYDTGSIVGPSGSFTVNIVQLKFAGYVLHTGSFLEGPDSKALSVGDEVKCKEVIGDHIDQKGSIVLPEKLRFDFSHGKPVQPEDLRKNESIVKQQIEAELEVSAQEIKLADAKHINGLRAVFGEIYPDPVRVVLIGRRVEDVLPNPESKEWLSISTELCGGTPISNTRDAAAFSLISEEDIAKGVRRITAATAECASQAMKLASSIETDINEASKLDGATLEKKIGSINNTLDAAAIPAARKADLKGNVSKLEVRAAELHAPTSDLPAKNDDTLLSEAIDECFEVGPVEKDAGKKGLSTIGEEVKQLAQRASDNSLKPQDYEAFSEVPDFVCSDMGGCPGSKGKWNYISKMNYYLRAGEASSSSSTSSSTNRSAGNTTQILVKFCGSTIPVQKNLNQLSTNMLIEHVCLRVGVRHNNLYSTFCGEILEPKQVLSYYQLQKDSTVYINPRLRGGRLLTIDFETWDDKMKDCPRDQTVVLHPDLIGPDNRRRKVNTVTYLSESLQYLAKQVLIGMCRNHFIGISFGGNFTSEHLLFDRGNFKFDDCIPIDEYSRRSALKDYDRISEIFDKAFRAGNKPYPMHAGHLINFLARTPPLVDPKSEAVIAYLTNHYSLLSHSQRIKMSEVLDSLREMLGGTDFLNFKFAIGKTYWTGRIEQITAMKGVYFYHAKWNKFGALIYIPYVDNDNASLLHFSDNFFKHARYPLQQLEAAFSLAMERENFMPTLLLDCMIKFRNVVELSGPVGVTVVVEEFIKEVISMLGKNTLCCKRSDEASTS